MYHIYGGGGGRLGEGPDWEEDESFMCNRPMCFEFLVTENLDKCYKFFLIFRSNMVNRAVGDDELNDGGRGAVHQVSNF